MLKNTPSALPQALEELDAFAALLEQPVRSPGSSSESTLANDVSRALQERVTLLEQENAALRERITSLKRVIEAITPEADEVIDICAICGLAKCNHWQRIQQRVRR